MTTKAKLTPTQAGVMVDLVVKALGARGLAAIDTAATREEQKQRDAAADAAFRAVLTAIYEPLEVTPITADEKRR